jgi:CoA:oxalate CoA-transferase
MPGPLPTTGPLQGVRVLDLSWILSGPFCTMTLCDLGADVIKVERPPWGDMGRTNRPLRDGESGYFLSVNRGKRSVSIDLKEERGRELFRDLVREVDVLVENFSPGAMDGLGVGYEALAEVNPRLIYAAISGFGRTGPWRDRPALDVIAQGAGGIMSVTGQPGGPPTRPGSSLGDITAGLYAAVGILAALHERERSGRGQLIDISMMDAQIAIQENAFMRWEILGHEPEKLGTRHPTAVPFQAFPTSDGWMVLALAWGGADQWGLLCAALDLGELIDDPRFSTADARTDHHAELEPLLNEAFRQRTTQEWIDALLPMRIPCGPLHTISQVAAAEQTAAREMLAPVEHHTFGEVKLVNTPVKLSRTPGGIRGSSPDMGAHSFEVLAELLGMEPAAVEALVEAGVVHTERGVPELG